VHQAEGGEQRADTTPRRGTVPGAVNNPDDDGGPDHGGVEKALFQRETTSDERAAGMGGGDERRIKRGAVWTADSGGGERALDR
jgi:hypothetical protein